MTGKTQSISSEGAAIEEVQPDTRLKARIDLWMHCNNMMWSRLQTVYFLQFAFFVITSYLSHVKADFRVLTIVLLIAIFFQGTLLFLVVNEQNDRNIQGDLLFREFGFDPTEYSEKGRAEKYDDQGVAHERFWILRYAALVVIFGSWMFIDLAAYIYITF